MSPKILALTAVIVVVAVVSLGYGFLSAKLEMPPYGQLQRFANSQTGQALLGKIRVWLPAGGNSTDVPPGRWRRARESDETADVSEAQLANLEALGYLSGSRSAPSLIGVTDHNIELAYQGLNLFNSGHSQVAVLMDMDGRPLHTWRFDFLKAMDAELVEERDGTLARLEGNFWRRVQLLPDGELLAVFDGLGLIKIDKRSRLIWMNELAIHHDIWVNETGDIYTLAREERMAPRFSSVRSVLDDQIVVLNKSGQLTAKVSVLDAFENSDYQHLLNFASDDYDLFRNTIDLFHTNTIEVLDGSLEEESPAFSEGNVLISIRHLNTIAIVDMEAESVVWALSGIWRLQHEPTVLESGNILVFDNRATEEWSRVLEINPFSQEIVWTYSGSDSVEFLSRTCGTAQRLPNGNTLITESDAGRAFEVTSGGNIVWEFFNPARAGDEDELIAAVFEVQRLDPSIGLEWLSRE